MGTAASVENSSKKSKRNNGGTSGNKRPLIDQLSSSSYGSVNEFYDGANRSFENVIDTTLQFSQVEASQNGDTAIKAKVYKKSNKLESVIDVFSPFSCMVGETIINQGASGEYMYVVESGLFEVTKRGEGKLSDCGVGHTFGELALLYNAKRSATVTCIQNACIWALDRHTFRYYQASLDKRYEKLALDVLTHVPLLKDLEFAQLAKAAEMARMVDFEEGDVIVREGEVGNTFYIVLEGVVSCSDASFLDSGHLLQKIIDMDSKEEDVTELDHGIQSTAGSESESKDKDSKELLSPENETKDGEEVKTYQNSAQLFHISNRKNTLPKGGCRLKCGEWFGEIALLTSSSIRTANVVADSSVRLLAFDRIEFVKVLGNLRDIINRRANNKMLSDLPIIARLPPKKRDPAVAMFVVQSFKDGDLMSKCGDPNPKFFFVKSGEVDVWSHPNPEFLKQQNQFKGDSGSIMDRIQPSDPPPNIVSHAQSQSFIPYTFSGRSSTTSSTESVPTAGVAGEPPSLPSPIAERHASGVGGTWDDIGLSNIPEPTNEPPPLEVIPHGGHNDHMNADVQINKIRHTGSEGDAGFMQHANNGGSFLDNVDEEIAGCDDLKLFSKLSLDSSKIDNQSMEVENSGKSGKRALPSSFDTSFEQMTSFEMRSFFAGFNDSKLGKAEAQWRKNVIVKKKNKTCPSIPHGEGAAEFYPSPGKASEEKEEMSTRRGGDRGREETKVDNKTLQVRTNSDISSVADCLYGDTFRIGHGEHIGIDAIASGTPMPYTMIAKGSVSCFVLTREDLNYILSEGDSDVETNSNSQSTVSSKAGSATSFASAGSVGNSLSTSPSQSQPELLMGASEPYGAPPGAPPGSPVIPTQSLAADSIKFRGVSSLSLEEGKDDKDLGNRGKADSGVMTTDQVITIQPSPSRMTKRASDIDWSSLISLGQIGSGTFGTVYMMQSSIHGATYAMKMLNREKVKKMRQEKRLETETLILKSLNCSYIIRLFDEMEDDNAFYLLLELVQGGELKSLIHPTDLNLRKQQQLDAEAGMCVGIPHQPAKFYAAVISLPIVYLHRRNIAYRDLKPENVMIDRFGYPKLIDFGLAKPIDASGKTHSLCGTPEYLAPEVISGHGHNHAVDWWSLGVLLYEMIVGISPFLQRGVDRKHQDHMVIFQNIIDGHVQYSKQLEPQCQDLIQQLLTRKAAFRLGCGHRAHKEFEEHDWFFDVVDWHALSMKQLPAPWIPPLYDHTDQSCFKNSI